MQQGQFAYTFRSDVIVGFDLELVLRFDKKPLDQISQIIERVLSESQHFFNDIDVGVDIGVVFGSIQERWQ